MPSTSQQFWLLPELQLELGKYLDQDDYRAIIQTSRANHRKFLGDAWGRVTGIGHLLAILHDDLATPATGRGAPVVEVPPLNELDPGRIERFLMYAAQVQRLKANSNPRKFISWRKLDRLLGLPLLAGRQVVMPQMTHFSIEYDKKHRELEVAPLIKLCANPWLQQIWVAPNRSRAYPISTLDDALRLFNALQAGFENETPLQWLSFYPESLMVNRQRRHALIEAFIPLSQSLRFYNTTIWFISPALIEALSTAPLERFEIQGSAPIPYFDVDLLNQLLLPEGAFAVLRLLLLKDVPLGFARQLLSCQPLINNVQILCLEVCNVIEIDEDEDILYVAVGQLMAGFPNLRELTLSSARAESGFPYPISMDILQPLIFKRLELLRLYRISISGSQGFRRLQYPTIEHWQSLRALSIMHQDLRADDLVYLTRLPNLEELGGNVGRSLAYPPESQPLGGFVNHITLTSQYRLRNLYASSVQEGFVEIIVSLLDHLTPRGMTLLCDRLFVTNDRQDKHDAKWVKRIFQSLKVLGKNIPRNVEWLQVS